MERKGKRTEPGTNVTEKRSINMLPENEAVFTVTEDIIVERIYETPVLLLFRCFSFVLSFVRL